MEVEPQMKQALVDYFSEFVTENRRQRMLDVLAWRTRYVTIMLEDVYQPHNASAVLRSCEIFGIQDVHIVEMAHRFEPNIGIALGAAQWLTLHRYPAAAGAGTRVAVRNLRDQGYRIVATTLRPDSIPLAELKLDRPLALLFGTEEEGLSESAHIMSDCSIQLPMFGFTQSFNISVTAALCLHELTHRLHRREDLAWRLGRTERQDLLLEWLMQSISGSDLLVENFLAENS